MVRLLFVAGQWHSNKVMTIQIHQSIVRVERILCCLVERSENNANQCTACYQSRTSCLEFICRATADWCNLAGNRWDALSGYFVSKCSTVKETMFLCRRRLHNTTQLFSSNLCTQARLVYFKFCGQNFPEGSSENENNNR